MECLIARKAMRAAFTRYRRHKCLYYLISFKRARARFRFQVKQAKRQSWINFLSTINWKTALPEVWNKIRKISGKYIPSPQPGIKINDCVIADPKDVSEAFATHFAKVSSKNHESPCHQQRIYEENQNLDYSF